MSASTCPIASSSTKPLAYRTYQDDNARQCVEWVVNTHVRIVSYPYGRGRKAEKPLPVPFTKFICDRLPHIRQAFDKGEGFLLFDGYAGLLQPQAPLLSCIAKETKDLITKYQRHPSSDEDFSTPFLCKRSRTLVEQLQIPLSAFGLRKEGCAIVDKVLKDFLGSWKGRLGEWIDFSNTFFFKKWCQEEQPFFGYNSFSSLAWGITAHFLLGIDPDATHEGHAAIWNRLFSPNTNILSKAKMTLVDYQRDLIPFLIKEITNQNSEKTHTFIAYWKEHKIFEKLSETLNDKELEEGKLMAEKMGTTLETHLLVSTVVMLMIGMQENFAFTMTEVLRHIASDPDLLQSCQASDDDVKNTFKETLRLTSPAGHSRQFRWDSDILYNDRITEVDKEDLIASHPIVVGQNPAYFSDVDKFDIHRDKKESVLPFGKGPHRCPGEIIALDWMIQTVSFLIHNYQVSASHPENLNYYSAFTMKHEPKIKLKLQPLGTHPQPIQEESNCSIT